MGGIRKPATHSIIHSSTHSLTHSLPLPSTSPLTSTLSSMFTTSRAMPPLMFTAVPDRKRKRVSPSAIPHTPSLRHSRSAALRALVRLRARPRHRAPTLVPSPQDIPETQRRPGSAGRRAAEHRFAGSARSNIAAAASARARVRRPLVGLPAVRKVKSVGSPCAC